jgi:hypothetical protein
MAQKVAFFAPAQGGVGANSHLSTEVLKTHASFEPFYTDEK